MKSLIVFILLLSTALTLAQPPDTLWTRTYGGSFNDQAYSVRQTTDGGYIVAGYTESFGVGYGNFYLVKTNSQGNTLWMRTYGGSDREGASSVQQTTDGGYIVVGYTESFSTGYSDIYLVKTNTDGDTLWTHTYGGSQFESAYSVQQTADGGYIVAGHTSSFGAGDHDFYMMKTNSQGDTLWTRTYGGTGDDKAFSVKETADEGYIAAGYFSHSFSDHDLYLVKTDSQGDTLWTRTYGGSDGEGAFSVQETLDGGYIAGGYTESFGADDDIYLVKTDSQGDTLWTRTYGGSLYDVGNSVDQTSDGGFIVAGYTDSFGAGNADFYLVRLGAESSLSPISLSLPTRYSLHPNYPNPFNLSTRITYDLPTTSPVTLEIFDLLGRRVATLAKGMQPTGTYSILFDGSSLPSGLYFYRLHAGTFIQTQKMILLK